MSSARCHFSTCPTWWGCHYASRQAVRGVLGLVEGSVAEHGEQDADAVAREAEEGLDVGFAAGSAAVVVAAGGGTVEGRERGEEHRPFQLPVPASGGVFAVD